MTEVTFKPRCTIATRIQLQLDTIFEPMKIFILRSMMGDACASSTAGLAARSGLGDRCGGDSGCWFSMVRRRTARGGSIGGGRGGGRGCDGMASRTSTIRFRRHCHAGAPPQPISICAVVDWRVDGVFASRCWLDLSVPCVK